MRARSHHIVAATVVVGVFSGSARAAGFDGTVPVTIRGEEQSLEVELYSPEAKLKEDLPIVRCQTPCTAHVQPGSYRLFVHATRDTVEGARVIDIGDASDLSVAPRSPGTAEIGLALGILGPIAAVGGAVAMLSGTCIEECSTQDSTRAILGFGAMVAGLVMTPVGWVMFGRSRHPGVEITPLLAEPQVARRAPLEAPHGTVVGLGVSTAF